MKIMIVDDVRLVRNMIESLLKRLDLEIVGQAENGSEAVELFEKLRPDIVTLDITMPEMDGLEALGRMLKIKPDAKIIIISALNSKATVLKAINQGAFSYLTKPINQTNLIATLEKIKGV